MPEYFKPKRTLSPIEQSKYIRIEAQDKLCSACMSLDESAEWLCSGLRPVLEEAQSEYYDSVILATAPCSKYLAKDRQSRLIERVRKSKVPSFVGKRVLELEDIPRLWIDKYTLHTDKGEWPSSFSCPSNPENYLPLLNIVGGLVVNGYTAKYFYPPRIAKEYKKYDDLVNDFVNHCDFLVVERVNVMLNAPEYLLEMFGLIFENRVNLNLPTVFTFDREDEGSINYVKDVLREVRESWKQVDRLSFSL